MVIQVKFNIFFHSWKLAFFDFQTPFSIPNATKSFWKWFSFLNMWIVEQLLSMTFYHFLWFWSTLFSKNVPNFWRLSIKPFYKISKNPLACSYWGVKIYWILPETLLTSTTVFMLVSTVLELQRKELTWCRYLQMDNL